MARRRSAARGRAATRSWTTLQQLAAPDVVDEDVDVPLLAPDPFSQGFHLVRVEMVDSDGDTGAAELCDELGSLLDRLGRLVVGPNSFRPAIATSADNRCACLAQPSSDTTSSTAGPARNQGDATAQSVWIH